MYGRYKDSIYRYVLHSVKDSAYAEDITHDAWLTIIDKAETFEPDRKLKQPFKQWLYRIAHNKLIDHWRRQKHQTYNQEKSENLAEPAGDEQALEQQYLWIEIERMLSKLPPLQQQSYLLQLEGFSLNEIAAITASQPETVKSRIRYSKRKIQQLLSEGAV